MSICTFKAKPLAYACTLALASSSMILLGQSVYAATAAGTQIKNLATVTYEDNNGNSYSAQSNEAIVTVAQVYSATIGVDVDKSAAPGQTVYLPYVLTNTGNGSDTFDLSALDGITGGDTLDADSITIYHDSNGSGEPDAGEPVVSSLTLSADEIANLVVAVQVPASATAGQTIGITLTAEAQEGTGSAVAQSVTDLSSSSGRDGQDSTNESLITVTDNAALVLTKSSLHDVANQQITYTFTVRNNGNQSAKDVVIFDGLPENTTYVSHSVSGILASNGDTVPTGVVALDESTLSIDLNADGDTSDADEAALGIDLNTDGDSTDTGVTGFVAVDSELPGQSSVSVTLTVSYTTPPFAGGDVVQNRAHASADTDDDGNPDTLESSNEVQDTVAASYGVTIADTGAGASAGVNDGGDDDGAVNDDQLVDEIAAGGSARYTFVVTNDGNADDIFELAISPDTTPFPTGTVFSFFDASGTVPLGDSNGSGVDTGVIAAGDSRTITVIATLPSNATSPATEYQAIVTATSANDPAATPADDTSVASLAAIVTATADIHNSANGVLGTDEDPLGTAPYSAVTTFTGNRGTTVNIPLYIDNEGGGADSYILEAGESWDAANSTLGALASGWSVDFFEGDGSGSPTGAALTTTPVIPAGALDFEIIAVVSVPSDSVLAISDYQADNNADSTVDTLDGNSDGDGDYPIFFRISSGNTGASDIKLDAVDVDATRAVTIATTGINQLEPGGSVVYGHNLINSGNVGEIVELTATNNQTGWTNTVRIDTDGDGVADTALGSLTPGNSITVQQPDGSTVTVPVTDADGDGNPELAIEPGVNLPLEATVFAPANASPGQVDVLTITAENVDGTGPSASTTDQTTVINGQVRLVKSVARDADCDGTAESAFEANLSVGVAPGECAIWQVVAENQGSASAYNVMIIDAATTFSTYEAGSLSYCMSLNCTPAAVTDAAGDDAGEVSSGNIVFFVGNNIAPSAVPPVDQGGELIPGEFATARFRVRVD